MPCRDDYGEHYEREQSQKNRDRANWFEATLCGVFTFLETNKVPILEDVLDMMDYEEMGITREEIEKWWKQHKKQDAARRRAEERKRKKEELKQQALAKLSAEERKALGIEG